MNKFAREPDHEERLLNYHTKIVYIDDRYAPKITDQAELDHPKHWFLSHHAIYEKSAKNKKQHSV